jgi:nucleotide-binding universal stress UspA family protein
MRFLVPTDFSNNALHASQYALTLAQSKPGSSIHLVHVLTPILSDALVLQDIENDAALYLEKIVSDLRAKCKSCHITYSIRVGEVVPEINSVAKEINTGFIIIGMQGLGKLPRLIFGSNAVSLTKKATCPVFIIPEAAALRSPKKIVFATDYYTSDADALQHLIPVATTFDSEIIIVHLFEEKEDEESELIMTNFLSKQIFKDIEYPRISYKVYHSERTARGIKDFCDSVSADLLVLSARKQTIINRLFRESVTDELSYSSEIPLLIFHL